MLEEERRLMYVAVTRAKEELYISKAAQRFSFGDFVRNPKSRFIDEIPSEHIETYNS
jgi:DNA helicase-2/ATP-dependent DNA helicase PcrA